MRLSEWRAKAPVRDALGAKVMAVVTPVLGVLDVEADPQVWVLWGDDPNSRYTIFAPIPAGLVVVAVRSTGAVGPRAAAKIVRWSRLQLGELSVETEGPHRMISFQLESSVLRGADDVADAVGRFALVIFAAVEGRPWPAFDAPGRRRAGGPTGAGRSAAKGAKGTGSAKRAPSAGGTIGAASPADRANPKLPALPARTAGSGPTASNAARPSADRPRTQP
ncbi:MAG TPA: hypothetical protein VF323_11330 [Candidatus Limnocylindrales bacterium]